MRGVIGTFAAAAVQPKPQAPQDALGLAIRVHESGVYLGVAALQEGAHHRGAGSHVQAASYLQGTQHSGGQGSRQLPRHSDIKKGKDKVAD